MANTEIDISALGQAIDSTWGRASTAKAVNYSVKMQLASGPTILATFRALAVFHSERQMIEMKRRYAEEGKERIELAIKEVKADYKAMTGKTLKLHLVGEMKQDLDIVNMNVHNGRRTCYAMTKAVYEFGSKDESDDTVINSPIVTWKNL